MYKVLPLKSPAKARETIAFLTSNNAFRQTWAPGEKVLVKKAVMRSLKTHHHFYWYVENDKNEVIAAIGVRENDFRSGGYEMVDDYLAVHRDYRRQGIATRLLQKAEKYIQEKKGRYLYIESCDIESYEPAHQFYRKNGFKVVGAVPNYYVPGEGRVDYFKSLKY